GAANLHTLLPQQAVVEGAPRAKNLVILLLESWPQVRMQDPKVTPNFSALTQRGVRAQRSYADGLRTTEGMFSIFCSWQNPLGATVAQSRLQNNRLNCLPKILAEAGYKTLFLQGSRKDTSGVGSFAHKLGFARSEGKESIDSFTVPHNSWGAQDVDIYNYALEQVAQLQEPFFLALNTNTTHDSRLPPGVERPFTDNRLNVLHYADSALGTFMGTFEKRFPTQFEQTLFVLVSDHTANLAVGSNLAERFAIPMTFIASDLAPKVVPGIASQRDVAPSVMSYLQRPSVPNFTGKSLLTDVPESFATFYSAGSLVLAKGEQLLRLNVQTGKSRCFSVQNFDLHREHCDRQATDELAQLAAFTQMSQTLLFEDKMIAPLWRDSEYADFFVSEESAGE
ncbi:MAG: LTA synthase family protein, partial [Pseudomonadales bacterium]